MKFTMSWLKDHLETEASVAEIAEVLTDIGLEVEGIVNPLDALQGFTIGKVLKAEQHPDADRLRVCQVATDQGEKQIICGAPNARQGITVVIAHPGTYIPGIDTTISVGKIRGVESHGMMCSEREMQLSDEHDGIIELPSGEIGESFAEWLAAHEPDKVDPIIEIAITPNRQDALGVHGIARDLAARGLGKLIPHEPKLVAGIFPCPIGVTIDPDTLDDCPHFAGRVVRGVKNGPSPAWLQARLKAIGLRPISALVDITNFFAYDMNRPLHVFDVAKVKGDLRVYRAKGGEEVLALDGKSYTFSAGQLVIGDDNGAESIGGVMGGEDTGCTEDTTDVFIESAFWDEIRTAYTGRDLKINSDARYRFERGVDPMYTIPGLEAATRMVLELCGGEASEIVEAGAPLDRTRSYPHDTARVSRLVGMDIPKDRQVGFLEALGFGVSGSGDVLDVSVPSWRRDIQGEADLVEEVARMASLTGLEGKPMPRVTTGVPKPILTQGQRREQAARRTAAALGYNECVTYSFIDQEAAALFGGGGDDSKLENPISSEMSHMRPALLPGLLQAAARNQARGFNDLALFEVGAAFHGGEPGEQHSLVTGLLVGQTGPRDPHQARRPVDLFDAKADAEAVLAAIGAPAKMQIGRGASAWWHPGRHGVFKLGPKKLLAVYGELHPKVLRALDVKGPAVAFTIWPEEVPAPRKSSVSRGALQISDLQSVERDFAFVVDAGVAALDLINAAAGADKELIDEVQVFDEFSGGSLPEGQKSIALTVRLQPSQKTLTDEDIEAVAAKIVAKVAQATGGVLRG